MAYLDGEIPADRAAEIAQHMQQCAECQAMAAAFRNLSREMSAWEIHPSPARLTESVLKAGDDRQAGKAKNVTKNKLARLWDWRGVAASPYVWAFACILVTVLIVGKSSFVALRNNSQVTRISPEDFSRITGRPESALRSHAGGGSGADKGIIGGTAGGANARNAAAFKQAMEQQRLASSLENDAPVALGPPPNGAPSAPIIARTASLSLVVKDFGPVEAAVKSVTARHSGYIGELNTSTPSDAAKTLSATLRVPSAQLEAALAELKQLGRSDGESQSGEEVTKQYVDLAARLKNSRATEVRLLGVLRNNTGKVKDVLEVENEISRVRGEIEEMEADQRALQSRVDFATITLTVTEEYKAAVNGGRSSMGVRLHNAGVEGYHSVIDNVIALVAWLLEAGPTLLLWAAILFFPARWAWRRVRRALTTAPKPAAT